jgi:hypothetical protein
VLDLVDVTEQNDEFSEESSAVKRLYEGSAPESSGNSVLPAIVLYLFTKYRNHRRSATHF